MLKPYWSTFRFKCFSRLEEYLSRAVGQKRTISLGKAHLNFRLARDQVVHLETAENLFASWRQAKDFSQFFSIFELKGITKHLMA